MKYCMVCCDVDGTIYRDNKTISSNTMKAIHKLKEKGVLFVLASGRSKQGVDEVWKTLGVQGYSICHNGNCVYHEQELLYDNGYTIAHLAELMSYMKERKIKAFLCTNTNEYIEQSLFHIISSERDSWEKQPIIIKMADYEMFKKEQLFYKISLYMEDQKTAENMIAYCQTLQIKLVAAEENFYDVLLEGHQKKDGVVYLAQYLKIPREKIICIGDNENDISMISYAGIGVAMENASLEVKKFADIVCESNEKDGVSMIINKFIL